MAMTITTTTANDKQRKTVPLHASKELLESIISSTETIELDDETVVAAVVVDAMLLLDKELVVGNGWFATFEV